MQDALFVGHLRHGERERRIDVAEQEIDLVALDQLARFLHRRSGVAAGGILDQHFGLASENSALGVDLLDGELAADDFVLAVGRVCAAQRIGEAELDGIGRAGGDHERAGDLRRAERERGLHDCTAIDLAAGVTNVTRISS